MSEPNTELTHSWILATGMPREPGASFPLGSAWLDFLGKAIDCHIFDRFPGAKPAAIIFTSANAK